VLAHDVVAFLEVCGLVECCESTKPQIGIIGAGVGGLSLAKLLKERGLGNITLIDRSFRVGGKSFSYKHEGLAHELGSCYLGDGYSKALEWMSEYGLEVSYVSEPMMYLWKPQPDNTPLVVDNDTDENPVPKQLGVSQLDSISFLDFVLGKPWNLWERPLAFFDICKYFTLWFYYWFRIQLMVHRMGITDQGLYDELAKPFEQWCDDHNLPTVKRFSLRSISVMLYGALSEIPTLYALRWNTPSLLFAGGIGRVYECVKGFDKLWECISWSQDVRLSSHVRQIHRVERDGVPKYRIIFTQPEHHGVTTHEGFEQAELLGSLLLDAKRVEHYLDVDHIVWTLHLDEINDVVIGRSLTSEEEKLFRLFSYFCVRSQLVEVEGVKWEPGHAVKIFQKGVLAVHRGHITGMRRTSNKTLAYRQRNPGLRKDFCVTYQYCPCNSHFQQGIRPPHLAHSNSQESYKRVQEAFMADSEVERTDSQSPLPISVTVENPPPEEKKFVATKKKDLSYFWPHGSASGVGSYEHQADRTLRKDIAEVGGLVKDIVVERRYLYHPLLQPERIRANEMLLLEKMQGKDNIWYSGASTSFETVNNIVNYNVTLADSIKYAIDIKPHCWWPRRAWFRFSRAWNMLFSLYNK